MRTTVKVPLTAESFPDNKAVEGKRGYHMVKATSVERGPLLANETSAIAARERFAEVVGEMLDTWTRPIVIAYHGWVGVCWQDPGPGLDLVQWSYRLIEPDKDVNPRLSYGSWLNGHSWSSGFKSMEECVRSCRHHMVGIATDYHDDESVKAGAEFLDEDQRQDHYYDAGFQRAYKHAKETFGESDPHRWACEHRREFAPFLETT